MARLAHDSGTGANSWRMARWVTAALLLLVPLITMQVTGELNWDGFDFAAAGTLIFGALLAYELLARTAGSLAYRAAAATALATSLLLVWLNLAVGIIGSEDNPANLMFAGVLAVGAAAALLARFRPAGMARGLLATTIAQSAVGLIAVAGGLGRPASPPLELLGLTAFFAALWLLSAWLFWKSARDLQPNLRSAQ